MTGKRKLLGGALCVLIAAQLCFGIYFIVLNGSSPCEFFDRLFACGFILATSAAAAGDKPGRV